MIFSRISRLSSSIGIISVQWERTQSIAISIKRTTMAFMRIAAFPFKVCRFNYTPSKRGKARNFRKLCFFHSWTFTSILAFHQRWRLSSGFIILKKFFNLESRYLKFSYPSFAFHLPKAWDPCKVCSFFLPSIPILNLVSLIYNCCHSRISLSSKFPLYFLIANHLTPGISFRQRLFVFRIFSCS